MTITARWIGLVLMVIAFAGGEASAEAFAIIVDIHRPSCPRISTAYLARARCQAERVFPLAGVRLRWRTDDMPLVSENPTSRQRHVVLVCGEIARRKIRTEAVGPNVLGEALHEVGHLVLRAHGHSWGGIMRAELDFRSTFPEADTLSCLRP